MLHEISVRWSWDQAYLNPVDFFSWPDNITSFGEKYQHIEPILDWPQGTLSCLHAAFTQKLGRQRSWCLDNIKSEVQMQAFVKAASVFKRGVHWSCRGASAPRLSQQGVYSILVPSQDAALATVLDLAGRKDFFVVVDRNVDQHWKLTTLFPQALVIEASEQTKTIASVAAIIEHARLAGPVSKWLVIGGGILGDIAGFAASLCQAQFCFMQTTLLAMADACVGGKTGVNFPPFGKNQIGSFAFPDKVIAWVGWLSTLPDRELRAGGVECLKHGFLGADQSFTQQIVAALNDASRGAIGRLLPDIIRIKSVIITQDPAEAGVRATLNLGHTLAHALEAISQEQADDSTKLLHGEAVAIGLVMAGIVSQKVCCMPAEDIAVIMRNLNEARCLPTLSDLQKYLREPRLTNPKFMEKIEGYISQDKKNILGGNELSQWILMERLGKIARPQHGGYTTSVDRKIIDAAWHELISYLERGQP